MEKVSVITVNWNVADSLERCVKSIRATKYPNLELIIIDNNSEIKPKFVSIQNSANIGLPRAWNQGLQQATGDYILILNPDTRLPADFFTKALNFACRTPGLGVIGPKFTDPDGTPQGSVFLEPSVIASIREYWLGQKGLTQKYVPTNHEPITVNSISGACMFFPKSTIAKIGKFTEKVFMYYEDLDYCRRIRQAGLKIVFHPGITIVHEHGASSAKSAGAAQKYHRDASLWYNGPIKHYLLWFILWSSQKISKIFRIV
ncbi:MAG: glycosyltransferase family 2 protein [Patescibacteria group bacterium]